MKKTVQVCIYSLFALMVLFPVGTVLCSLFGYRFLLLSNSGFAMVLGLLSVCATVLSFRFQVEVSKASGVLAALLPGLTLVSGVFLMLAKVNIFGLLGIAVGFVGSCCLTVRHTRHLALRIVALVIAGALTVPTAFLGFIVLIFGSIGQNTVVQSVESPEGNYTALVINSDQGALGGDTLVEVQEKGGVNLLVLRIEKKPQRVYSGQWGEFDNMKLSWKDEGCLVINGTEYAIQ